jgi:hypothetical protein
LRSGDVTQTEGSTVIVTLRKVGVRVSETTIFIKRDRTTVQVSRKIQPEKRNNSL